MMHRSGDVLIFPVEIKSNRDGSRKTFQDMKMAGNKINKIKELSVESIVILSC